MPTLLLPMLEVPGYAELKLLARSPNSEVYLGVRERDRHPVVLKRHRGAHDGLRSEADALERAAGPGVPRLLEVIAGSENPALVMERAPGVPLAQWAAVASRELRDQLRVAIGLVTVLERVHQARLIHRDVTPYNVLVEPDSGAVALVDFGLAQAVGLQSPSGHPSGRGQDASGLAGTLAFMAPEQTGRMNRRVDARSDLYALGSTFYWMLTGKEVFEERDALALIHAHMARVPRSPREHCPEIPEPLARIVLRLLCKEPEERYQSAGGLREDLERCLEQVETHGQIDPALVPGAAERSGRLVFSPALIGRGDQIAQLRGAYERAAAAQLQLVVLEGEAGSGKSALVDALRPELARTHGYLARGVFDAYAERPLLGVRAALSSLVDQVLLESDVRLSALETALREGLGNLWPVAADLVPELRFVVGEAPAPTPLEPAAARARLSLALRRLLRAFATPERPLVLFFDEMHVADPESRFLIVDAAARCECAALLVIAAFRTDAGGLRAREQWVQDWASRGGAAQRISLDPLGVEATAQLVCGALRCPVDANARALAQWVHRKTEGNPQLIQQFVEHVHASGLLQVEAGSDGSWDLERIAAAQVPDGAAALMIDKIDRLDPQVRSALELAACVGPEFDLDGLCELSDQRREQLESRLYALLDAGLIAPCSAGFCFSHNRVREAAQERMGEQEQERLHGDIALSLIARIPEAERAERAGAIVEHLNRAPSRIGEELRLEAARLNHEAAKRNLAEGAAASAYAHLRIALDLFRSDDWEAQRALGFSLHLDAAESALQLGSMDEALQRLAELDRRSPSRFEFTQIAVKRIGVYGVTLDPEGAARYLLEVLSALGVRWPLRPSRLRATLALRWVQWRLSRRPADAILRPATAVDLSWLAPILVLGQGGGILIRHSTHLTALASCLVLRTYARRGYIGRAPFSLASFSVLLQSVCGDAAGARRFADAALQMNERAPDPTFGPRTGMQIYASLEPWLSARREPLERLRHVVRALEEQGDIEYAYYTRFLRTCYLALAGIPVAEALREWRELAAVVHKGGLKYPEPAMGERVFALLASAPTAETLAAEAAAEEEWSRQFRGWALPCTRTLWLMALCVYGRFDLAFEKSLSLEHLLRIIPYVHVADHLFYQGLAAAALATDASGSQRRLYRRALTESERRLSRWARGGPDFAHMALLLSAERARLGQSWRRSEPLFAKAAQRAEQQLFPHHAALAHERHGRMLSACGHRIQAAVPLGRAIALYEEWGVQSKADRLRSGE